MKGPPAWHGTAAGHGSTARRMARQGENSRQQQQRSSVGTAPRLLQFARLPCREHAPSPPLAPPLRPSHRTQPLTPHPPHRTCLPQHHREQRRGAAPQRVPDDAQAEARVVAQRRLQLRGCMARGAVRGGAAQCRGRRLRLAEGAAKRAAAAPQVTPHHRPPEPPPIPPATSPLPPRTHPRAQLLLDPAGSGEHAKVRVAQHHAVCVHQVVRLGGACRGRGAGSEGQGHGAGQ